MDGPSQPKDIEVVVWQGQRDIGMLGCIQLGSVLLHFHLSSDLALNLPRFKNKTKNCLAGFSF